MQKVFYQDWKKIPYDQAWAEQERYMQRGLELKSKRFREQENEAPTAQPDNYLFICEHPHVYTLGKSGVMEHLLANNEHLKKIGAAFFKTNRGGDITYHGPGQMVAYPILDLEQFFTDLGKYMRQLEEVIIRTIAHYGLVGGRLSGSTGVWLEPNSPASARKICAMGVRSSRWITMHGLALNINTQLEYFDYIVPCGITDKGVTSIQQEVGRRINEEEVKEIFLKHFAEIFQVDIKNLTTIP